MTTREKIRGAIDSGFLLCSGCPMQGVKEGYFAGDDEVSFACYLCGVVEGRAMGSTDELIDEIGVDKLEYLAA